MDDRHYIYVATADIPRMLDLGATIGLEDDTGNTLCKLRAPTVEELPELPKSAERIAQRALTGVRMTVAIRSTRRMRDAVSNVNPFE